MQALNKLSVGKPGNRERSKLLQRGVINIDDDNPIIVRPLPAKGKPEIQRAQFDVLQKCKSGSGVPADPGISEEHNGRRRDGHRQCEIQKSDGYTRKAEFPRWAALRGCVHAKADRPIKLKSCPSALVAA